MKKSNFVKRLTALALTLVLGMAVFAGCGTDGNKGGENKEKSGKILFLATVSNGCFYDFFVEYYETVCSELGYNFEVVYADGANDPDGNLAAVRNAYTSDVVGMITSADGGLSSIMEEYPDLYVCGLFSELAAVYDEDGTSHEVLSNDKFLGCMGDNYLSGKEMGEAYAQEAIDRGYEKVSTIKFPVYAYPKHTEADEAFRAKIEEYNKTASKPIEVVGDATTLQFKPLDGSYFLEEGHDDLDAIVGFCSGMNFIYPALSNAKADGTCSADTQLITGGFEVNEDILADCGDDKTIVSLTIMAPESALFPIVMLDNAISGKQFSDYTTPERYSSGILVINSEEKFEAMKDNSPLWAAELDKMQLSLDDMYQFFTRNNESATYADLVEATTTKLSIDGYLK